jgi:hypothetical protein
MIYKLANGYRVRVTPRGEGTEFETRNAAGETISTVVHYGVEAARMVHSLRIADGMRFGRVYGGGITARA